MGRSEKSAARVGSSGCSSAAAAASRSCGENNSVSLDTACAFVPVGSILISGAAETFGALSTADGAGAGGAGGGGGGTLCVGTTGGLTESGLSKVGLAFLAGKVFVSYGVGVLTCGVGLVAGAVVLAFAIVSELTRMLCAASSV